MTWQQLFKGLLQVAQLAFLMPNFRYLTFLTVIWREKILFGMFSALFGGVGSKKMLFGTCLL